MILVSLPLMLERKGATIVNVSSIAGKIGNPRGAIYSATKFCLAGLSEALYYDPSEALVRRGTNRFDPDDTSRPRDPSPDRT